MVLLLGGTLATLGATAIARGYIREGYLSEVTSSEQPSLLPPSKPSGYLCLSTAVHIKTATCNLMCNDGRRCPEVCLCMRADASAFAASLSSTMPSEAFLKLARMLESPDEVSSGSRQVAFDASTTPQIATSAPKSSLARLPDDMAGYYMKSWNLDACKTVDSRICQGPDKKNINVHFSGEAILAKALSVTLKQQMKALEQTDGVCSSPDKRFCNQQVHNKMPWEAKTRELAIEQVIAPGAWVSDCDSNLACYRASVGSPPGPMLTHLLHVRPRSSARIASTTI